MSTSQTKETHLYIYFSSLKDNKGHFRERRQDFEKYAYLVKSSNKITGIWWSIYLSPLWDSSMLESTLRHVSEGIINNKLSRFLGFASFGWCNPSLLSKWLSVCYVVINTIILLLYHFVTAFIAKQQNQTFRVVVLDFYAHRIPTKMLFISAEAGAQFF